METLRSKAERTPQSAPALQSRAKASNSGAISKSRARKRRRGTADASDSHCTTERLDLPDLRFPRHFNAWLLEEFRAWQKRAGVGECRTQAAFARLIGLTPRHFGDLLAGRSQASPDLQLTVLRRWIDCAT